MPRNPGTFALLLSRAQLTRPLTGSCFFLISGVFFGRGPRFIAGGRAASDPPRSTTPRGFYGPWKIQMLAGSLTLFSLLDGKIQVASGRAPALAGGRRFPADSMDADGCTFQGKPVKKSSPAWETLAASRSVPNTFPASGCPTGTRCPPPKPLEKPVGGGGAPSLPAGCTGSMESRERGYKFPHTSSGRS